MRRLAGGLCLFLALAALARGEITIVGLKEIEVHEPLVFSVAKEAKADSFLWRVRGKVAAQKDAKFKVVDGGRTIHVWAAPGQYVVEVTAAAVVDGKATLDGGSHNFKVEGDVRPPIDPPDVDPKPPDVKPKPPDPKPGPGAPAKLVRVLVVYETGANITLEQDKIIRGKAFRDYMKTRGTVDKANPIGPCRIWDQNVDTTHAEPAWKALMARKRDSVPWCCIEGSADGTTYTMRFEGPLPASDKDMIALIDKVAPRPVAKGKAPRKGG